MTATEYKYITLDDEGVAHIGETRYKVKHLAAEVLYHGYSPYELNWQHPDLTLAEIYSALAYYADNKAALDADIIQESKEARLDRALQPPDLREQLLARRRQA